MKNGQLEHSFTNVIVQGGSGKAKKKSEFVPSLEHVGDSLSQSGVWLDLFLFDLVGAPSLELLHHRSTVDLVELEALVGGVVLFLAEVIKMVDLSYGLDHVGDFIGKGRVNIDEVASRMGKAVGGSRLSLLRVIAGLSITHLDGGIELFGSMTQY